jgi:hypothetical protein
MITAFLLSLFWPGLRNAGQVYFEQGSYDVLTTSMLIAFQIIWLFANAAAGFVTRWIAGRQLEVWLLATILLAYFAYNHLWTLWAELPAWYNLLVVIPVVPMVLVGSLIAGRSRSAISQ